MKPARSLLSPGSTRLLQLALTLLVALYMLLAGGTFDATLRYRVKLLNTVAATALVGLWLLVRWRQRRPLAGSGLEWALVAFALSQWLAVVTSLQPRLGLEWAASVLVWVVMFWLLLDVFSHGWNQRFIIQALLLVAAVLAAHGLVSAAVWLTGWLAAGQLPPVTFRYIGLLGHANLTACLLNMLLPVVVGQLLMTRRRPAQLALGALAAAMLVTEYLTSSRAGWLACAATLAVLAGLWALRGDLRQQWPVWRARWQRLGRAGQALLVVAMMAGAAGAAWLLIRQSQHITHGSLFQSRSAFWGAAWQLFTLQPLTGAGPDLFPWYYSATTSIPPGFFAPHAHSLVFQILSGSGLMGLAALVWVSLAAAVRLWRHWRADGRTLLTAGLIAGLAGFAVQHLFDNLLGTPLTAFLVVVLAALALAPSGDTPAPAPSRPLPKWLPGLFAAMALAVFGYSLRAEAINETGLDQAARGEWAAAGASFAQAAQADPGLDLYTQSAAYAYTRAGQVDRALPLWMASVLADPYWAALPATVAVLTGDQRFMQSALALAPASDLLALNAGALAEARQDEAEARAEYSRALDLRPASAAALFWQQTPLRRAVLSDWQAARPAGASALAQGEAALARGAVSEAITGFEQARADEPASNLPYAGLARAYWAAGDRERATAYLETGLQIPVATLVETLPLRLLAGEFAAAEGDRATAQNAWADVFSAYSDYTLLGPGTYGYPQRSWYVYHRAALPSDLVPQFVHADITAAMDADFALLASWFVEDGQPEVACAILARVHAEAPESISGERWAAECGG